MSAAVEMLAAAARGGYEEKSWPWAGTGLSSNAIASGSGRDYPHDPADLLRCVNYCRHRYSTTDLRKRMASRSPIWDRLTAEWDNLRTLLKYEIDTRTDGTAPVTYLEMKRVIAGGTSCVVCGGTGRGDECVKCKGTGRRSGGRCRADNCFRGADFCPGCRGRGYTGGDR